MPDVEPASCWYVGDGGSREHAGARRAGVRPVLLTSSAVPAAAQHRDDPDDHRPPLAVADLDELPGLVQWPAPP